MKTGLRSALPPSPAFSGFHLSPFVFFPGVANSESGYGSASSHQNQDYSSLFSSSTFKDDLEDFQLTDEEEEGDKDEG